VVYEVAMITTDKRVDSQVHPLCIKTEATTKRIADKDHIANLQKIEIDGIPSNE
jgi:hypothetical protein